LHAAGQKGFLPTDGKASCSLLNAQKLGWMIVELNLAATIYGLPRLWCESHLSSHALETSAAVASKGLSLPALSCNLFAITTTTSEHGFWAEEQKSNGKHGEVPFEWILLKRPQNTCKPEGEHHTNLPATFIIFWPPLDVKCSFFSSKYVTVTEGKRAPVYKNHKSSMWVLLVKSHRILVDPYMFGKRWKRCSKILDSRNVTTFICLGGWVHYMHREGDQYLCRERSRVGVNWFTYQQHAGAWDFSAMWASKPTGQTYKKQYHQWNCSLIDSMPNREENIKTCNGVSQIVHLDCYTQDLPGSLVLMCLKML
jgi:hypothetical protein